MNAWGWVRRSTVVTLVLGMIASPYAAAGAVDQPPMVLETLTDLATTYARLVTASPSDPLDSYTKDAVAMLIQTLLINRTGLPWEPPTVSVDPKTGDRVFEIRTSALTQDQERLRELANHVRDRLAPSPDDDQEALNHFGFGGGGHDPGGLPMLRPLGNPPPPQPPANPSGGPHKGQPAPVSHVLPPLTPVWDIGAPGSWYVGVVIGPDPGSGTGGVCCGVGLQKRF